MTSLAEIVQTHGDAYRLKYGAKLLPSHQRTLRDLADCQTAKMGGHAYYCDSCDEKHYQYHSCQNRHCPQCQQRKGEKWLEQQIGDLLPVPYFMLTFTLPSELHELARQNQKVIYNILFRSSSQALQELAWDPRHLGAEIGMVGVLHTWGRDLSYHPHVHYLVPAGGLSANGDVWVTARRNFLVPVKALSILFRAKFCEALQAAGLGGKLPPTLWQKNWVSHCKPVGKGVAALKYLAPYIFRVAISNQRILRLENGLVTFRYRNSKTGHWQQLTLSAEEFLRRFLQHILPKGFVKVRYYGLFSPSRRHLLPLLRLWLGSSHDETTERAVVNPLSPTSLVTCPNCGQVMRWLYEIRIGARYPPKIA